MAAMRTSSVRLGLATAALVVACGGPSTTGNSSELHADSGSGADAESPGSSGVADSGGHSQPEDSGVGESVGAAEPGCSSVRVRAELREAFVAFAFDVSGSMGQGDQPWHDKSLKWDPATEATRAFLENAEARGMSAALTLFPNAGDEAAKCDPGAYGRPDVAMMALPSNAFASKFKALELEFSNKWRTGTPTLPALAGIYAWLSGERSRKAGTYAAVLLTDGEPQGCGTNNANDEVVREIAAALADGIPTYVIGVPNPPIAGAPNFISTFDAWAAAGGTDQAFILDLENPNTIQLELLSALNSTRRQPIPCTLAIPGGLTVKPEAVRVSYTSGAQPAMGLSYDPACAAVGSFSYDDPARPREIVLCEQTCRALRGDPNLVLEAEFNCQG
jgi:hypothetical protein